MHLQKNQSAQQFLSSQFCAKTDRTRLQNLIPVQLHEACFSKNERLSPPHNFTPIHGIKPSQKPQSSQHKPNMSLQSKNPSMDHFNEKLNQIKKRDYSPYSQDINLTPNTNKFAQKSASPMEIKESVANLLNMKTEHSPKNGRTPKQLGPYLSIQQQQALQFKSKSNQKTKGHSSANSVSYGSASLAKQINSLIKKDVEKTPTKFSTTITTEHSKSKSVAEDQFLCKYNQYLDKENEYNLMNVGTPSTFLTSKTLDQHSIGESAQSKFRTQQSPALRSGDLQESFPVKTCVNHKTKKAKYMYEDQKSVYYYCSKCAVKLAGQGMHFTEINMAKSAESQQSHQSCGQILSFQNSSLESNRQSTAKEITFKEHEMNSILSQLNGAQQARQDSVTGIQSSGLKVQSWYDNQLKQCADTKNMLQNLMNEAYNRSVQRLQSLKQQSLLQIQEQFTILQENHTDCQNIQNDIQRNWNAVLEGIDVNSFKSIMEYYYTRIRSMDEKQAVLMAQKVKLHQLAHSDIEATKALILQNFELQEEEPIQQQIRTQPTPPKKKESLSHRVKTDVPQKQESAQNFYQYFFDGTQTQQPPDPKPSARGTAISSQHSNNLYVSFENKEIFMNALEQEKVKDDDQKINILQSYRGSNADIAEMHSDEESPKSTPHSPASGQCKQIVQRTASKTVEDLPPPKDAFVKSKNTFRTLFDGQLEETQANDSVSPSKSEKYRQFLNRISTSQSKTQQFYQGVIVNSNSKVAETPDIKKYELQDTETCKKAILSHKQSMELKDSIQQMNMLDDQNLSDYYEDEADKEVQTIFCSKEMRLSEKKQLTIPSESSNNTSGHLCEQRKDPYQKTLFCSPTFKDQDLNISDSSQD